MTDETYTVHFKSNGSTKDDPVTNFERRVMSVQNQSSMDLEVDQYLNEELYDKWRESYETE